MKLNYIYGTAWKKDLTSDCVFKSIEAGYRGIDTANQRKHYNEAGVGVGLQRAYTELNIHREDLFIQSKFTFAKGQDHRKPYNESDSFKIQVRSSFNSSLTHLHTEYLDSYILHGPFSSDGLGREDIEVWREMEALHKEGLVKKLGVSNVSIDQLRAFYEVATIKPQIVQIRCFAENMWEKEIREFCKEHNILFQGFSLLTANRKYLGGDFVKIENRNSPELVFSGNSEIHPLIEIVSETGKSQAQIIFKFCHQIGILPITGTRTIENMKLNLNIEDFNLSESQISQIENIAFL